MPLKGQDDSNDAEVGNMTGYWAEELHLRALSARTNDQATSSEATDIDVSQDRRILKLEVDMRQSVHRKTHNKRRESSWCYAA